MHAKNVFPYFKLEHQIVTLEVFAKHVMHQGSCCNIKVAVKCIQQIVRAIHTAMSKRNWCDQADKSDYLMLYKRL